MASGQELVREAVLWRRLDSPGHDSEGFAAELLVTPRGFVRQYPGLWEMEG